LAVIEECKQLIQSWLAELNLELKPSKTSITHTLHPYEGKVGFNFLGWQVRQYPVGKTHTGYNTHRQPLGFKTFIKPSKEAVLRHLNRLKEIIDEHKTQTQQALINHLNPVIRGWSNYYASGVSKEGFSKADNLLYYKLQRWAKRRHPTKSGHWISAKYWRTSGNNRWSFATPHGESLYRHTHTPIVRHTKVKADKSPFDGDWLYWSSRQGHYPGISNIEASLLKRQKGKCARCELFFRDGDVLEIDHIIPKAQGGRDNYFNKQLLHRHCHDVKTREESSKVKEVPITQAR
jgi:RNA-directed DNA polymerase